MGLWNVWTALATGLLIGASLGMLLTALLTISSRDETAQPEVRQKKADGLLVDKRHGEDAATSFNSVDSPAEPRLPFHFH
ncbi:MAG: hypothetical protein JSW48_07815 [Betaproteobacteria bacterium]|jgi:hypothetical protein|nr:MAG: hypothetical protein JSW48_07815 [Betaproteobacteria bacterium]